MTEPLLHGYWRSGASYRVRIALNLKGVRYHQTTHDLRTGAQRAPAYLSVAPQGLVPALDTGDAVITQSPAILEWLDERFPDPPLLPSGAAERAQVRAMAALIGCDVHPLNNLRCLDSLRRDFGAGPDQVQAWISRWITEGFVALETMIARVGDGFCFGGSPGLADCYLIPQVYSAQRFDVDLSPFPRILGVVDAAAVLPQFRAAHPSVQPDADG